MSMKIQIRPHGDAILIQFICFLDSKLDLPKNWTQMSASKAYELVPLLPSSQEYVVVSQEFARTCQRQIIKVGVLILCAKPFA